MSFLNELDAEIEDAEKAARVTYPVGGTSIRRLKDGTAVPRYGIRLRPPAEAEQARLVPILAAAAANNGVLDQEKASDLLILCCDAVVRWPDKPCVVNPGDPDYEASWESDSPPLRFDGADPRWELEPDHRGQPTARRAVAKLYKLDKFPLALSGISAQVLTWLEAANLNITARVEGKSPAKAETPGTEPTADA